MSAVWSCFPATAISTDDAFGTDSSRHSHDRDLRQRYTERTLGSSTALQFSVKPLPAYVTLLSSTFT
jgi:hypothetical protein